VLSNNRKSSRNKNNSSRNNRSSTPLSKELAVLGAIGITKVRNDKFEARSEKF
jgi:hypothetical protein